MDRLLTITDVAALFAVSKMTVQRWVAQGALPPPVRFGRRCIRWRPEDLAAFVQAQQPATTAETESEVPA